MYGHSSYYSSYEKCQDMSMHFGKGLNYAERQKYQCPSELKKLILNKTGISLFSLEISFFFFRHCRYRSSLFAWFFEANQVTRYHIIGGVDFMQGLYAGRRNACALAAVGWEISRDLKWKNADWSKGKASIPSNILSCMKFPTFVDFLEFQKTQT